MADGYQYGSGGKRQAFANTWLNRRLDNRLDAEINAKAGRPMEGELGGATGYMQKTMSERIPHMLTPEGYEDKFRTDTGPEGMPNDDWAPDGQDDNYHSRIAAALNGRPRRPPGLSKRDFEGAD